MDKFAGRAESVGGCWGEIVLEDMWPFCEKGRAGVNTGNMLIKKKKAAVLSSATHTTGL